MCMVLGQHLIVYLDYRLSHIIPIGILCGMPYGFGAAEAARHNPREHQKMVDRETEREKWKAGYMVFLASISTSKLNTCCFLFCFATHLLSNIYLNISGN